MFSVFLAVISCLSNLAGAFRLAYPAPPPLVCCAAVPARLTLICLVLDPQGGVNVAALEPTVLLTTFAGLLKIHPNGSDTILPTTTQLSTGMAVLRRSGPREVRQQIPNSDSQAASSSVKVISRNFSSGQRRLA